MIELTPERNNLRRVVCAACQLPDGSLIIGARHWDSHMHDQAMKQSVSPLGMSLANEGFIDQFGHFLTRAEAWHIAVKQNQIIRRVGGDSHFGGTLYSENLY